MKKKEKLFLKKMANVKSIHKKALINYFCFFSFDVNNSIYTALEASLRGQLLICAHGDVRLKLTYYCECMRKCTFNFANFDGRYGM